MLGYGAWDKAREVASHGLQVEVHNLYASGDDERLIRGGWLVGAEGLAVSEGGARLSHIMYLLISLRKSTTSQYRQLIVYYCQLKF